MPLTTRIGEGQIRNIYVCHDLFADIELKFQNFAYICTVPSIRTHNPDNDTDGWTNTYKGVFWTL